MDSGREALRVMRRAAGLSADFARAVLLRASAKWAPAGYQVSAQLLDSARMRDPNEQREYLALVEEEAAEYRTKLAALDQQYLDLIEEQQLLSDENNRLRAELNRAYKKLAKRSKHSSSTATAEPAGDEQPPDTAYSPSAAAASAQLYLSDHLSFPDEACVELDLMDSAVEARAWGATAWRAFRALHAYGEALQAESYPGSFWTWCENSKHPYAWTATSKKLAMAESQTVNNSEKLRRKRIFPIAKTVEPSGELYMQAHIKIAEGGGPKAPRIYFHSNRETGTVHIGYFGPHKNVPNSLA